LRGAAINKAYAFSGVQKEVAAPTFQNAGRLSGEYQTADQLLSRPRIPFLILAEA
jgi:hypothetical protein